MDLPDEIRAKFKAWGKKGGDARREKLSAGERVKIARKAGRTRWGKKRKGRTR